MWPPRSRRAASRPAAPRYRTSSAANRSARRSRRRPRRHRKPRREFLRRRGRAGVVAGHRRSSRRRALQSHQYRRQHDRPPHAALRGVRLGGGAARRSRQSAGVAPRGAVARRGRGAARRTRPPRAAWRAVRRDAPRHRSPNAGYPEAAMAGALGLSLAGPRSLRRRARRGRRRWATAAATPTPPISAARWRSIAAPMHC